MTTLIRLMLWSAGCLLSSASLLEKFLQSPMVGGFCMSFLDSFFVGKGNISIASRIRTKLMTLFIWTFILVSMFPVAVSQTYLKYDLHLFLTFTTFADDDD